MRKQEIKKLRKALKKFEGKEIFLQIKDPLYFCKSIENAVFLVSDEIFVISNEEDITYVLDLGALHFVKFRNGGIMIKLLNDVIVEIEY